MGHIDVVVIGDNVWEQVALYYEEAGLPGSGEFYEAGLRYHYLDHMWVLLANPSRRVPQARKGEIDWEKTKAQPWMVTAAILKDGQWQQTKADTYHDPAWKPWETEWWLIIESLPDDTLLTLVDCHD